MNGLAPWRNTPVGWKHRGFNEIYYLTPSVLNWCVQENDEGGWGRTEQDVIETEMSC